MEEERVLDVLPGRWVVEIYRVGGKVGVVVRWGLNRFEDTSGAEGGRVVVTDFKGNRVGSSSRMCPAFHGEVLGQG